jgi:TonB-linked SusC/RagA family outer membrane protein
MRWTTLGLVAALLLPAIEARAQAVGQIAGTVTNETGQPLAGASVVVVGTAQGATTRADGGYVIPGVPAGPHDVRVTQVGYGELEKSVTVAAGQTASVDFQLTLQALQLEGVVAVGYGTQRREEITSAVASVSSEDFVQAPARDAASLIAGKVPGLAVVTPTGDPTQGTEIMLRGTSTIQGPTAPLVLIDGVPGSLSTVAPQDIESISVLKDASAGAVYGSRASNGVILITTKRYQGGNPTIRYDGYASYQTLYRQPEFLSAGDYRRLIADGYGFEDLGYTTDWQDQVLRNPWGQTHNLTLTGGTPSTNYLASLNYDDRQGIFIRSDNRLVTGRINVGHSMFDGKLKADLSLLSRSQENFTGPDYNYAWRQTLIRNPTDRVQDDEGAWQERGTYFYVNPVGWIDEANGKHEGRDLRMHGTLTYAPFEQLRLSMLAGTTMTDDLTGSATTFRHVNTTQSGQNGTAFRSSAEGTDRILELTGTYDGHFGGNNVTLLGGYSYQDSEDEGYNVSTYGFPTDIFGYDLLGSGSALSIGQADLGSFHEGYKLIGFFSRLNYDWDDRFLLTGSLRYEGNSKFGAANKWGLFPALSAGWRLGNERFMAALPWVDELKLRAGYGVTGIAPRDPYLSLTSFAYGDKFPFDGSWVQGLSPARNPNPDLRWERKEEIDVGVDYAFLDSRLAGSVDVYRRDTKDMLYRYSVPSPPFLFGDILANVGHMRNSGIEAQVGLEVVRARSANWTSTLNWSTNRNRLLSLSNSVYQTADYFYDGYTGEPIQQSTHRIDVGGPIGNFYGWRSVGIDDDGVWIVEDSEGNPISIKDAKEKDRHILGNGIPKQYLSWNNSARLGSFDVGVNMRGAFGFQILNFQRMFYENPTILQYNMLRSAFDPVYGKRPVNYDLAYVSYYIEDGDYWKLDNVTLGYTLPDRLLSTLAGTVTRARIFATGRNLYTFTGYEGLDPEVRVTGLDPGNDPRDTYPTTRTFSLGVNLTF